MERPEINAPTECTEIEISVFIENVLKYLIKQDFVTFKCNFTRRYVKVTREKFITSVKITINNNAFIFESAPSSDANRLVRLVKIVGPIINYTPFTELVHDLLDNNIKFDDDLYDGVFDNIDIDAISDSCINYCACATCSNFVCGLKHCQVCKYDDTHRLSNIFDDRSDCKLINNTADNNKINIDEIGIRLVDNSMDAIRDNVILIKEMRITDLKELMDVIEINGIVIK